MILELAPPTSAGPLRIGMTMTDAAAALRQIDGYRSADTSLLTSPGIGHYESGLSIMAHPAPGGLVEAIEVWRPGKSVSVRYQGKDVFEPPAAEVADWLRSWVEVKEQARGATVVAPSLHLAFWRPFATDDPNDAQGYYFQSVLVAAPGYG